MIDSLTEGFPMLTFLANYGLFLAKTLTIVLAIIALLMTLVVLKAKAKADQQGSLHIKKLNEKNNEIKNRLFVMDFDGDIKASAVDDLRETITAILLTAKPTDRVLLRL